MTMGPSAIHWNQLLAIPSYGKILLFFIDNAQSVDTPRGISAWTGVALPETRIILEDLARRGILTAYRTTSTVGYTLVEDNTISRTLARRLKTRS